MLSDLGVLPPMVPATAYSNTSAGDVKPRQSTLFMRCTLDSFEFIHGLYPEFNQRAAQEIRSVSEISSRIDEMPWEAHSS